MSGCKNKLIAKIYDGITRRFLSFLKRNRVFSNDYFKVLMFHDIGNEGDFSTPFFDFCRIVDKLISLGFSFVDVDDVTKCNSIKCLRKKVLLTFDDGFESTFSLAYPYLKNKGIPFCVFITTSFVNKQGYLSDRQLRLLSKDNLCTIGSHFVNHNMSRFMDKKAIIEETNNSFEYLKKNYNIDNRIIALPYGSKYSCSNKDLRIIKKTGVSCIFTTIPSFVRRNNPYHIPRIDGSVIVREEFKSLYR